MVASNDGNNVVTTKGRGRSIATAADFRGAGRLSSSGLRRVAKTRFTIEEPSGATWEIDRFADRELVLAEIELERADTPVSFPRWLAPHVEREVTDDPAFTNAVLDR